MTRTQFSQFREELRQECDEIARVKGGDYAGDQDVLSNFERAAEFTGLSRFLVWQVYAAKHIHCIFESIRKSPEHPQIESEPLRSRICDAINYLILLGAMLEEIDAPAPKRGQSANTNPNRCREPGLSRDNRSVGNGNGRANSRRSPTRSAGR